MHFARKNISNYFPQIDIFSRFCWSKTPLIRLNLADGYNKSTKAFRHVRKRDILKSLIFFLTIHHITKNKIQAHLCFLSWVQITVQGGKATLTGIHSCVSKSSLWLFPLSVRWHKLHLFLPHASTNQVITNAVQLLCSHRTVHNMSGSQRICGRINSSIKDWFWLREKESDCETLPDVQNSQAQKYSYCYRFLHWTK